MTKEWAVFYTNLPNEVKLFLDERINDLSDFEFKRDYENSPHFLSISTNIEIAVCQVGTGFSFSVWFDEPKKNNEFGDPTYTDHCFNLEFPFLSFLEENIA